MKHVLLFLVLITSFNLLAQLPPYRLGAALDGFSFSSADRIDTYGGSTYEVWEKEATSSSNTFLLESDDFANKWQNNSTPFNSDYTLFFGDGASPDAVFSSSPTIGNYYIFKIRRIDGNGYANLSSIVLELSNAPVTISSVNQTPSGTSVPADTDLTITATLSAIPSTEENIYIRYSFDNFVTYGTVAASSTPTSNIQNFTIPGQSNGTTVNYYLFTTTLAAGTLNGNSFLTDLATINISNNGGTNFTTLFPIEYAHINLTSKNSGHNITFTTATETNNAYFNIERSTDSRSWEKLGSIAGAGTTQQEQQYSFLDKTPLPGLNYYRVKQVDYDGSFSYSAIVSARWEGKAQVHLFPNPTNDLLQISGLPSTEGPITIEIIDMAGRIMLRQTWNQSAINVASLADGVYSLRISSSAGVIDSQRLFIH